MRSKGNQTAIGPGDRTDPHRLDVYADSIICNKVPRTARDPIIEEYQRVPVDAYEPDGVTISKKQRGQGMPTVRKWRRAECLTSIREEELHYHSFSWKNLGRFLGRFWEPPQPSAAIVEAAEDLQTTNLEPAAAGTEGNVAEEVCSCQHTSQPLAEEWAKLEAEKTRLEVIAERKQAEVEAQRAALQDDLRTLIAGQVALEEGKEELEWERENHEAFVRQGEAEEEQREMEAGRREAALREGLQKLSEDRIALDTEREAFRENMEEQETLLDLRERVLEEEEGTCRDKERYLEGWDRDLSQQAWEADGREAAIARAEIQIATARAQLDQEAAAQKAAGQKLADEQQRLQAGQAQLEAAWLVLAEQKAAVEAKEKAFKERITARENRPAPSLGGVGNATDHVLRSEAAARRAADVAALGPCRAANEAEAVQTWVREPQLDDRFAALRDNHRDLGEVRTAIAPPATTGGFPSRGTRGLRQAALGAQLFPCAGEPVPWQIAAPDLLHQLAAGAPLDQGHAAGDLFPYAAAGALLPEYQGEVRTAIAPPFPTGGFPSRGTRGLRQAALRAQLLPWAAEPVPGQIPAPDLLHRLAAGAPLDQGYAAGDPFPFAAADALLAEYQGYAGAQPFPSAALHAQAHACDDPLQFAGLGALQAQAYACDQPVQFAGLGAPQARGYGCNELVKFAAASPFPPQGHAGPDLFQIAAGGALLSEYQAHAAGGLVQYAAAAPIFPEYQAAAQPVPRYILDLLRGQASTCTALDPMPYGAATVAVAPPPPPELRVLHPLLSAPEPARAPQLPLHPPGSIMLEDQPLASCAFGAVYHGWMPDGTPVAVKVCREDDAKNVLLMRRDALFMAAAAHPYVVKCHGLHGSANPLLPYNGLVMQLGTGSLLDRLRERCTGPRPSGPEVAGWMFRAARALEHMHSLSIVHGDLKPENLILGPGGEVLLGDFGLAQVVGPDGGSVPRLGTPAFMSPQLFGGQNPTKMDDIWALAMTLYTAAFLVQPFAGASPKEIGQKVCTGELPPIPDEADPLLSSLLEACWSLDPHRRPTIGMVARYLEELAAEPLPPAEYSRPHCPVPPAALPNVSAAGDRPALSHGSSVDSDGDVLIPFVVNIASTMFRYESYSRSAPQEPPPHIAQQYTYHRASAESRAETWSDLATSAGQSHHCDSGSLSNSDRSSEASCDTSCDSNFYAVEQVLMLHAPDTAAEARGPLEPAGFRPQRNPVFPPPHFPRAAGRLLAGLGSAHVHARDALNRAPQPAGAPQLLEARPG